LKIERCAKNGIIAQPYNSLLPMTTHNPENLPDEQDQDDEIEFIQLSSDDEEESNSTSTPLAKTAPRIPTASTEHSPVEQEDEEELPPSKTKVKQQMHALQDIGKELVTLNKDQLAQLDLPESLRGAIREMHRIKKFGAIRRQMQYIGKLMRHVDPDPIVAKLDIWKGRSNQHVAYTHQLERWRDRLLDNSDALTTLLDEFPNANAQHLRNLIRNARKEKETNKPPKSFREIYQTLREIIPQPK